MNSPDPALCAYVQRRLYRSRHRDAERHTLARREAARIRSHAYDIGGWDEYPPRVTGADDRDPVNAAALGPLVPMEPDR